MRVGGEAMPSVQAVKTNSRPRARPPSQPLPSGARDGKSRRVRWKVFLARVTLPVPSGNPERWQSGRMRRSRKPVCPKGHREFESLLLRLDFDRYLYGYGVRSAPLPRNRKRGTLTRCDGERWGEVRWHERLRFTGVSSRPTRERQAPSDCPR